MDASAQPDILSFDMSLLHVLSSINLICWVAALPLILCRRGFLDLVFTEGQGIFLIYSAVLVINSLVLEHFSSKRKHGIS